MGECHQNCSQSGSEARQRHLCLVESLGISLLCQVIPADLRKAQPPQDWPGVGSSGALARRADPLRIRGPYTARSPAQPDTRAIHLPRTARCTARQADGRQPLYPASGIAPERAGINYFNNAMRYAVLWCLLSSPLEPMSACHAVSPPK